MRISDWSSDVCSSDLEVTAYEAGLKATLADRAVQFNAAGFYYDYRDKQIRGKLIETPDIFWTLDTLANVPKSRIYGFETDVTLRPVPGLTIGGGVTYLNSRVQQGPPAPYNYNVLRSEEHTSELQSLM